MTAQRTAWLSDPWLRAVVLHPLAGLAVAWAALYVALGPFSSPAVALTGPAGSVIATVVMVLRKPMSRGARGGAILLNLLVTSVAFVAAAYWLLTISD